MRPQRGSRLMLITGERYTSPLWRNRSPLAVIVMSCSLRSFSYDTAGVVCQRLNTARPSSAITEATCSTSGGFQVAAMLILTGNIVVGLVQTMVQAVHDRYLEPIYGRGRRAHQGGLLVQG